MFQSEPSIFEFKGPFGVPVQIGGSIIFLALIFILPIGGSGEFVDSLIFFGLVILAIFLHEFGHAWGTLVQGHDVKRVMIFGGGGFCERWQAVPPRHEEFIVAMGPIVNLALWAICGLSYDFFDGDVRRWVWLFGQINIFLFFLNMIPVQPLDGGKLFALGLMRFVGRETATRIAGWVGVVFAILWIPAMIWCYVQLGFLLLFMPSITMHWRMARGTS